MNFKKLALAAAVVSAFSCGSAMAATTGSTMTVSATLTSGCEVSPTSSIGFGSFIALRSSLNKNANSGSTFQVACSLDNAAPTLYSASTRTMTGTGGSIPFTLSVASSGGADLAAAGPVGSAITLTQDGVLHDVVVYGQVLAANYAGQPSVAYSTDVTLTLVY